MSAGRLLLLMSTRTYRSRAFMSAARRLGVEVVVGSEQRQALANRARSTTLTLDFRRPSHAADQIVRAARERPYTAVVGVDDDSVLIAAHAAARLGLRHNTVESVKAAQDKFRARKLLARADLPQPSFQRVSLNAEPRAAARRAPYPCVLKPLSLSASRGVIRANDPDEFVRAFQRIRELLASVGVGHRHLLVESFVAGPEVALEGLLADGDLRVLALFDKPDPLDGPYFEETLYVTPSRLSGAVQMAIQQTTAHAAAALGLREGPIHAELRMGEHGPCVVEVAPRSIGGLCSNTLRFGVDASLEELILRHAVGLEPGPVGRERVAAGVMMLPIPQAGILRTVRGRDAALEVPGVEDVSITIPVGQRLVPLPEGDRYLGFAFARAGTPEAVETALREAHRRLEFVIAIEDELANAEVCLPANPRSGPRTTGESQPLPVVDR